MGAGQGKAKALHHPKVFTRPIDHAAIPAGPSVNGSSSTGTGIGPRVEVNERLAEIVRSGDIDAIRGMEHHTWTHEKVRMLSDSLVALAVLTRQQNKHKALLLCCALYFCHIMVYSKSH
jgi:hypothetical protein